MPVFGGHLMLLSNRQGHAALARIDSGAVTSSAYPAAASNTISWYQNIRNLDVDSAGHCYIPRRDGSVLLFDAHGFHVLPAIGLPRMEDSAHRIWFVDPQRHVLTALDPGGARAEFHDEALSEQCSIVEDKDHTYWTYTPRGLLHLSLGQDGLIQSFGPVYSRGIPSQDLTGMWIDPQRNLWLATRVRLFRAQLP
jgi:ligand-binding sensor domain-containing protein